MTQLFGLPSGTSAAETGLLVLSAIIVALLAITFAFSMYAVLLRLGHARRERLWADLRGRWEEGVLTSIADPDRAEEVHALVPKEHRLHFVQFVLEYTRRVRGVERKVLRRLVDPYLDPIVERARHRNAEVRTRAMQTLGTLGLPRYADVVIEGLDDPSPLVSMVAARYLAREEYPQFAPEVMKHIHRFQSWNRRYLSAMLATIGPEAAPALRDGLADDTADPWVRSVYAEALTMQRDARAADLAIQALASSDDRTFLASLLRLLAVVGRPPHLAGIRALCSAPDEVVRGQAFHALGVLGGEAQLEALVAGMDDPSPWVALHAARGVYEAGGVELLEEAALGEDRKAELAGQVLLERREG